VTELVTVDPLENPEQANAQIQAILNDSEPERETGSKPIIEPPPDSFTTLPGMGSKVEIRELTGEDEEALARVQNSFGRWVTTLLERAIVSIDGKSATKEAVAGLLVGDRDFLLLAIRRVTWGSEIEVDNAFCTNCQRTFDTIVHADDVPVRKLTQQGEVKFTVELRRGRKALVRLPNGADQAAYLDDQEMTNAQRNTILLQRCIETLFDEHGNDIPVAGFPSVVREGLSLPDRAKLLREVNDRMPGTRYNEVKVTHEDCGEESTITLGLVALFPDIYVP
jgi:hypothetical protein